MKKIFKPFALVLTLVLALMGSGGCHKFLNVVPDDGSALRRYATWRPAMPICRWMARRPATPAS